jgi:Cu/Ag efflux pump CusA
VPAAALALVVVACAILPSLGWVCLPEFRAKSLMSSMVLYPGVSLEMTNRAGLAPSKTPMTCPLFEWVQVRAGRSPGDADGAGVNLAHVDVELSDQAMANRPVNIRQLRQAFLKLPGVAPNIGGFISRRMDEVLSGVRSAIAIKIYGPDLGELRRIGEQVRDTSEPIKMPLGSLARIDYGLGANVVNREDVSRLIVVSTNVNGRALGSVVADIQKVVDSKSKLTSGYLIRYGGQFKSEERATANPVKYIPIAILFIGGMLSVAFLIGFITLFEVAVRNGLLLVDSHNRRHAEGM